MKEEYGYSKKEYFKLLIKEFQENSLPTIFDRDLQIPLNSKKIVTIYGPRRSGKSFYFFSLIQKLLKHGIPIDRVVYLNFEDDRILPLSYKEMNYLLEAYFELYPENKRREVYLFFDEIQNVSDWEIFIRRIYEKEKVKIYLTGSSSKLLSPEIATSLRGRTISYRLFPLDFKEFLNFKKIRLKEDFKYTSQRYLIKKLLSEYMEWGSFPEVVLEEDKVLKRKILSEYFDSLVYRDLMERYSLENSELLKELLKYLFTNVSCYFTVNAYFNTIKQVLSLSRQTLSQYLSYIQETFYISFLPIFSYSLKAQKVNPKKIICLDNGLRKVVSFNFSPDRGKLAENLVGANLMIKENRLENYGDGKEVGRELFYWKNDGEVDFVIKEGIELIGLNVCYSNVIPERETISLFEFKRRQQNVKKLIIITEDIQQEVNGIDFIPLWEWIML
jgi:hypothetical protein